LIKEGGEEGAGEVVEEGAGVAGGREGVGEAERGSVASVMGVSVEETGREGVVESVVVGAGAPGREGAGVAEGEEEREEKEGEEEREEKEGEMGLGLPSHSLYRIGLQRTDMTGFPLGM
jgi:hypothetical protein